MIYSWLTNLISRVNRFKLDPKIESEKLWRQKELTEKGMKI